MRRPSLPTPLDVTLNFQKYERTEQDILCLKLTPLNLAKLKENGG